MSQIQPGHVFTVALDSARFNLEEILDNYEITESEFVVVQAEEFSNELFQCVKISRTETECKGDLRIDPADDLRVNNLLIVEPDIMIGLHWSDILEQTTGEAIPLSLLNEIIVKVRETPRLMYAEDAYTDEMQKLVKEDHRVFAKRVEHQFHFEA